MLIKYCGIRTHGVIKHIRYARIPLFYVSRKPNRIDPATHMDQRIQECLRTTEYSIGEAKRDECAACNDICCPSFFFRPLCVDYPG